MVNGLPQPRINKSQQTTQLSYELPHRIHTAKVYPVKSSNGSTVILYGHEKGVRVVWRGGRAFKPSSKPTGAKKVNGAKDAVISLDSDEEESAAGGFTDKPDFEEDEEELDPARPYPTILQTLDLYFGTDVLHLALLPTSALKAEGPAWRGLELVKNKIVFTAACADNRLHLVTLPLTPPSPESKSRDELGADFTAAYPGNGAFGETVTALAGHEKPSHGVTMTADFGKSRPEQNQAASIIIASHSREVTGLILLYRIPVKSSSNLVQPFQKIFLSTPAASISFNPSLALQRSSHLLIADATGACRIYDYHKLTKSAEEATEVHSLEHGSFVFTLYTSFQPIKDQRSPRLNSHKGFGRKGIIDAQWVSGGSAIMVLLADGEWAMWDIEGLGPGMSKEHAKLGSAVSEYSLSGYIEAINKARSGGAQPITASKFAPMTPSTRKLIEPFSNKESNGPACGQISVVELAPSSPTTPPEESILLWIGGSYACIPSLNKYWSANYRKAANGTNLFNNSAPGSRMLRLEGVDLLGERCTGVAQIPGSNLAVPDMLILGEHRLTIMVSTNKQNKEVISRAQQVERPSLTFSAHKGELDVVGIDQALARMENGASKRGKLFTP